MMKHYKKEYEDVFSDQANIEFYCDLDKISTYHNNPEDVDVYTTLFQQEAQAFERGIFDHLTRLTWLRRRFVYRGKYRGKSNSNGVDMDRAYGIYVKNFVGYPLNYLGATGAVFPQLISYMDDFFPNFDSGDPFKEEYVYPYQHMNFSSLILVAKMDERMELLEEGEKKKMSSTEFMDYVLNYMLCFNEEFGEKKYEFIFGKYNNTFVKKLL